VGIAGIKIGRGSISVSVALFQQFFPSNDVCVLLLAGGTGLLIQQMILMAPRKAFLVRIDEIGTPLSAFSYTLYLTHYPIIRAMRFFGVPRSQEISSVSIANCLLMIAVSLAAAWGLYWLFERRTPEVRAWLRNRIDRVGWIERSETHRI
jgi:peptidoglycan/LPS O-acetylase OafA/YrhL